MDYNIEYEAKRRLAQCRKNKWTGVGVLALAIVYLLYMQFVVIDRVGWFIGGWSCFLIELSIFLVYGLLAAAAFFIMRSRRAVISSIMTDECDPFLYEACLNNARIWSFRDRAVCNRALAQYYQGNFEAAWNTFHQIQAGKLRGGFKANYYMVLSALYFRNGMGGQVRELEEACRISMKSGRGRQREQRYFQMLCTGNNYLRAMENQDYESAFRFVQERRALGFPANRTWNEVGFAMWEARIYLGLGEKESARLKLQYVIDKGGRMYYVEEARKALGTG